MDSICPVLDTGLVQLEFLAPVSEICRYKLFPDLDWTSDKNCIESMLVYEVCEEDFSTAEIKTFLAEVGAVDSSTMYEDVEFITRSHTGNWQEQSIPTGTVGGPTVPTTGTTTGTTTQSTSSTGTTSSSGTETATEGHSALGLLSTAQHTDLLFKMYCLVELQTYR